MSAALARAGIDPEEVDYINPHGTSTPINDRYETMAIRARLRRARRQAGRDQHEVDDRSRHGSGRRDRGLRACTRSIETGCIPPTINYRHPDPELTLDYVPNEARAADVRVALSNSMGLGGHNSSVILRRYEA